MALMTGVVALAAILVASCSSTKYIPENQYLLKGVKVVSDSKDLDAAALQQYVRQRGNSKWFSLFKIPLGVYAMAGSDTAKWINRTLRNVGEAPVLYDTLQAVLTQTDLLRAMQNMGYMNASVSHEVKVKGKKLKAIYLLHPGEPYIIRNMRYDIQDENIARLFENDSTVMRLKTGDRFTINGLEQERNFLTAYLLDRGYYKFHKEYIRFEADTARGSRLVDLTLQLSKYRARNDAPETNHPVYKVRKVTYASIDSTSTVRIKRSALEGATAVEEGQPYRASDVQRTYNGFSRLDAIRFANLRLVEVPDSGLLDCNIQYGVNKPSTISFQPEGTNTAGDLGAAVSITYQNRNLFHGSEMFSVQLRGAYEAITGLEGYQNEDYIEYGVESKIEFPRFVAPFLSAESKRRFNASSELSFSYDMQNRPEFHRRVLSSAWRYRWGIPRGRWSYKLDAIDLNYIYMPWISGTFKSDYLDNVSNRNAILRYNYEDLFVMRMGFGMTYNDGTTAMRFNMETGGNLLKLASSVFEFNTNDQGQRTLFDIAFAQYVKGDFDYTRIFRFDHVNSLVMHLDVGVAYHYGNSRVLPFEKRYFSGGANSVRGWSVRGLGPGSFKGSDGAIDFINQTGDMKLDINMEYRTHLFWKFNGAFFVDAGNIWTLREYKEQPGGQFKINEFYKQIAVAYGLGVRLNFDYFILRFDMGMKAIDPAYEEKKDHYPILHHNLKRDFTFHFAVGMPF